MIATSTDTDPESAKNTCSSPGGVISTSVRASSTAGAWVRPPNITWLMAPSWSRTAASRTGWAYPCTAAHHDDMPSTSSRPSARRSHTPSAATIGSGGTRAGIGA